LLRQSLLVHPSVFMNQTLWLINPHYLYSEERANQPDHDEHLDAAVTRLCRSGDFSPAS
jgi:hypothetical protein